MTQEDIATYNTQVAADKKKKHKKKKPNSVWEVRVRRTDVILTDVVTNANRQRSHSSSIAAKMQPLPSEFPDGDVPQKMKLCGYTTL